MQFASTVHEPGQLAAEPLHTYGAQAGAPAVPAELLVQVPTLPARLQASQAPAQAVLQHTPSTQLPATHSLSAPQVVPRTFLGTQAEPLQYWPTMH